jgi:hypothetical protein
VTLLAAHLASQYEYVMFIALLSIC